MNTNAFQPRSLKTRITIISVAIFLIGIWSVTFYITRILRDDMQRMLGNQLFSTVSFVASQVNEDLDQTSEDCPSNNGFRFHGMTSLSS